MFFFFAKCKQFYIYNDASHVFEVNTLMLAPRRGRTTTNKHLFNDLILHMFSHAWNIYIYVYNS